MQPTTPGQFLLHYLRPSPVQVLADTPWEGLLQQAERHQLLPLLYSRIGSNPQVPQEHRTRLRAAYMAAAARNLQLYAELERILASLNARGIEVILLKGVCLAQEVYGNVALRPMCDIDLVARRDELAKVVDCLRSLGYAQQQNESIDEQCAKAAHLNALTRPGSFPIEVHWHIEGPESPFGVDLDGLWQRRRPVKIGAQQTFMLSPEDMLLHLCLHATRHAWRDWYDDFALKSLCDIAQFARTRKDLDWELLAQRAVQWKARRPIFLMLTLAREWLGAAVSESMLTQLLPGDFDPRLLEWAQGQIVPQMQTPPAGAYAARIRGQEPLHRRMTLFLHRLFPPAREIRKTYSLGPRSPWLWACYLLRLVEVLRREIPAAWRSLRGDREMATATEHEAKGRALRQWLGTVQAAER